MSELQADDLEYVLLYDDESNFTAFPAFVLGVRLLLDDCLVTIARPEIIKRIEKDPEGRNSWDFHVNESYFESVCNKTK